MGAYGIFLRVFNLISHGLAALTLARYIELNMRREIPCLQAAIVFFYLLYKHLEKKSTLFTFSKGECTAIH